MDLAGPRRIVDLVRHEQNRSARAPEQIRDFLVAGRDPDLGVDDEKHEIGLVDRRASLFGDLARDRRTVGEVDSAGVDEQEALSTPLALELLAVARNARGLVDDGGAGLGEPVHERRLADIREADDRGRTDERLSFHLGQAGGVACRGRPSSWASTRKRHSPWISRWISAEASR